ncbi:MAG: bifunctional 5,10-methylenetetrahydrofolate dehydrogenase/5,10-methenyltetrahydrofolate cyclohydrolase [SAR202 cluster bacterium]|nr:bifunctional 5,10-methylenetetrahydrofolate dehydrogenase/5,10-methenyltetrahydrofolate cyclohydrolase [SAR202 cluster bacterium]
MVASIINGTEIAAQVKAEVAQGVAEVKQRHGVTPGLAVVLVGDDPASAVYVASKQKAASEAGMHAEDHKLATATPMEAMEALLKRLNADANVHGILIQLPLPKHLNEHAVMERISPDKDVDGLHPVNMGLLLAGRPRFVPATPAGIQQLLLRTGHSPEGKHVVVCGRSDIVGKPVAALLMHKAPGANATVTVCHTGTRDLPSLTRQADILIAAMGRAGSIKADMVKDGVVVIDVGTNRFEDASKKSGYRLVGDVDYEVVSKRAAAITPVPGGVGPMTIAMLLANTLKAAMLRVQHEKS